MACDDNEQSLLTGLLDPTIQNKPVVVPPKRMRFRRCKSAPLADDFIPQESVDNALLPRPTSIFVQLRPSFRKVALYLFLYVTVGTICFYLVKDQIAGKRTDGVLDAVYFTIVTMTTVGYGDLVPNSTATKLLACAFVFSGMVLIGLSLSKAADYLVENQEILLVKALHLRQNVGSAEILKELETNRVRYKCFLLSALLLLIIVSGTVFLVTVEKLEVIDAFYCVCSTITTLGYGDKSFSTEVGRIFAIFWILTGTICLAQLLFSFAELNTERRQRSLVSWVLKRKTTITDLEAADLDDDGVVGAAEFILYKLKEMGKINQEDISLIMEEFENLDVDNSGSLSQSDIMLAQSSQRGR